MPNRISLLRSLLQHRRPISRKRRRRAHRERGVEPLENRDLLAVVPVGDQGLVNETIIRDQHNDAHSVSAAIGSQFSSIVVYDGLEALAGDPNSGRRDRDGIFVARYDREGNLLDVPTLANTTTRGEQDNPAVAADDEGNFVVVWHGRGFDSDAQQRDRQGIWMRAFNADGTPVGDSETLVNTTVGGRQHSPSISMAADGRFVISWNGVGVGDVDGVFVRSFAADGTPDGDEVLVNSTVTGEQNDADVDLNESGEFVVAWNSRHQDGDSWGVFGQAFAADGTSQGDEIQLNSTSDSSQYQPAVGINNDGSFLAAWTHFDETDSKWEIATQSFAADGTSAVDEFIMNPTDDAHQRDVDIAAGDGQFLAAWSRGPSDGSGWEVTAQLFNSDGTTDGTELELHSNNAGENSGHQRFPAVTMNSIQETLIVWTGQGPIDVNGGRTGDHQGVFGRRFESDAPQENVPPNLATVDNPQAVIGAELEVVITATDANPSDVLTFIIDQDDSATGATIEKTGSRSAVFRWTPTTTDGLGEETFRILVIDDGDPALSDTEEFTVTVVEDPPEVDLNGPDEAGASFTATFRVGVDTSISIVDTDVTVTDRDNTTLQGGTVTITNLADGAAEELDAATAGTNISALYDDGVLTLTGSDSIENYQQVLASLTYANSAGSPDLADRQIEVVLSDGTNNSSPATTTVAFEEPDLVAFAQALSASGSIFYGAGWCPHCTEQKEAFQDGQFYLPFVEVTNPDRTPNQIAIDEGIGVFPTWEFPDGSRLEGQQSLETLSERSGVEIPTGNDPSFVPIDDQVVLVGSPLHVPLDGYDPNGGALTYSVSSNNPQLEVSLLENNRSFRVETEGFGDMVFELFEQRAPRATDRFIELSDDDFFEDIIFHRVINDFVIQGGDPTGTGSGGSTLGDFDDQFHVDLQHNRTGLLSMAKTSDDTNDSQFFVTEGPQRHLDFNHTIFGVLVEGESNRDNISNTDAPGTRPSIPVTIESTNIFSDVENAVLMLKADAGATGTATVTVTVTDAEGHSFQQDFDVTLQTDTDNGGPFLTDIPLLQTNVDTPLTYQVTAVDVENDPVVFDAQPRSNVDSVDVDADGILTVTPPSGFTGTMEVLVSVSPATSSDTTDPADSQLVRINVS